MKAIKFLGALVSAVMAFTMLAVPVSADEGESFSGGDDSPKFALDKSQTFTVEAGKKNDITFFIKNISDNDSKTTLITAKDEGGKLGITGNNITSLGIDGGRYTRFQITLDVPSSTLSGKYPLKLEFVATNNDGAISEQTLVADIVVKSNIVRNALAVSGYTVSNNNVKENNIFDVTVKVKNGSGIPIKKGRIELKGLDGQKFAMNKGVPYYISDFAKDEEKSFTFTLIACSGISSVREAIDVECSYYLDDADEESIQKSNGTVTIACSPKKDSSGGDDKVFAPNIIIKGYDFGGDYVTGGKVFPLSVSIQNTSGVSAIKNLKVTVNGASGSGDKGIAFSPANSSNSFFFSYLGTGASTDIQLDMLTRADATPDSYPIEIVFDYEYTTTSGVEKSSPVTETITIPVQQEDRFTVNSVEIFDECMVGEEVPISCTFVNKGKSAVYNVEVELVGDGLNIMQKNLYIGNVESGKEEYYDSSFSVMEPGEFSGKIIVRYEDSNGNQKEIEKEFSGNAMEMYFEEPVYGDDMPVMEPEMNAGMPVWAIILIIAGSAVVVAGAVVTVVIIVKKKKATSLINSDDDEDY